MIMDRPFKDTCGNPSHYYNESVRRCCHRCPEGDAEARGGLFPTQQCPQSSADCRKQCEPDYHLNEAGRCTACVSCSRAMTFCIRTFTETYHATF
ncbi:Tumor necrosis factor receptor super member 8 [Saguinus oedipus]|uniref:Tumor necrosis factor receptor super member 8 n=1 Tax=Saguinus oedipus TaxID=9490 RepID=A0ABQ9V9B1_SAGOE|nr:Tumor necrosis factor receptor super member 8 [Saguinus oedipus]